MDNKLQQSEFLFYSSDDGTTKIQVILEDGTVWVTQKSMAEIFDTSRENVTIHLGNIFESKELSEETTCKEILQVQKEGDRDVKRPVRHYNLDAIISVGYRISSQRATQFRIWASSILKEYLTKGFVLNDERLKQGSQLFGEDYFNELLERIREIRASERRFYQKITDLYATAIDYDPHAEITQIFYSEVQNKLHWAVHHHTAAELIAERADAKKPHMGLTTWKHSQRKRKILKTDVSTAKNYLTEAEITELNRLVSMYLDFAENMANKRRTLTMKDWVAKLDAFLEFNEYGVLDNLGRISAKAAKELAEKEYEKFRVIQDREFKSDFDRVANIVKETGKLPSEKKEELSDYNKKLKQALDYDPDK